MTDERGAVRAAASDRTTLTVDNLVTLLDHLPARVAYWDLELRNVFCNEAYAGWFGLTPDEVTGKRLADLMDADTYRSFGPHLEAAVEGRRGHRDTCLNDLHGQPRHVSTSYVPHVVDGSVRGVYTLGTEITDRVRAAEAERSHSREVAAFIERERIATRLHQEAMQLLYAALLTLEGSAPWEQRERAAVYTLQQALRDLRGVVASPGSDRPADEVRALTPWTAAELVSILDCIPAVVALWGSDLRVRFTNATANRWFGRTRSEVYGMDGRQMLGEDLFELNLPYMMAAIGGREQTFVRTARFADGDERVLRLTYIPNRTGDGVDGFFVLGMEVTELMRAEASLRDTTEQLAVLDERRRIAADIHDLVVQRLFAAGLETERLAARVPAALRPAVEAVTDDIDDAIARLRSATSNLTEFTAPIRVDAELDRAVRQAERSLGFPPRVNVTGDLSHIPAPLAGELIAVLTEALSNAARHAKASHVQVVIVVDDHVTLDVVDDGCGLPETIHRHSGLANMEARATALRGWCRVGPREPSGTWVTWSVPLA